MTCGQPSYSRGPSKLILQLLDNLVLDAFAFAWALRLKGAEADKALYQAKELGRNRVV